MTKHTITLTDRELRELEWFVATVLDWGAGGPYGDGEDITHKQNQATMVRVLGKLTSELQK